MTSAHELSKPSAHELSNQLKYPSFQSYKNAGRQSIFGYEFTEVQPTTKTDSLYEFDLNSSHNPLCFGVGTGFRVTMCLQTKAKGATDWTNFGPENAKTCSVIQNYFEHYIKALDVFHVNSQVKNHDLPPNIDTYLNTFILAHMDKRIRNRLAIGPAHPYHAVTVNKGDFKALGAGANAGTNSWTSYAAHVTGGKFSFVYLPLNRWPFYQHQNYILGPEGGYSLIPIHLLGGRMQTRLLFKDTSDFLFKKITGDEADYRLNVSNVTLYLRELRLGPSTATTLKSYKSTHYYRGLTLIGLVENIPTQTFTFRTSLNSIDLPEGLFIFCVDKRVVSSTYKYQNLSLDSVFLDHNIKSIDVFFDGQPYITKTSTFGIVNSEQMNLEKFDKFFYSPPFGFKCDESILDYKRIGLQQDYCFDNLWLDFTVNGPKSRFQPLNSEVANLTNKTADLQLTMNFGATGAHDHSYIICAYYTDYSTSLDAKHKKFIRVYNKKQTIN